MKALRQIPFILLILFCSASCVKQKGGGGTPSNPLDPTSPDYVPPVTAFTAGPADGSIHTSSIATFTWSGSRDVASFETKVDGGQWIDAGTQTSFTMRDLDERLYSFSVRSKHRNGAYEATPPQRSFTVDAVKGQSLMFYPRLKSVRVGNSFAYEIRAEEVSALMGVTGAISYQTGAVVIDSVSAAGLTAYGGRQPILFFAVDRTAGKAQWDLVVTGGVPKGMSGSGTCIVLHGRALVSGTTTLSFTVSATSFRDTANSPISINKLIEGKVVTE